MSESESIVIRRAEPGDAALLGRLGAALMRQHHAFDPHRFLPAEDDAEAGYEWFLREQLESAEAVIFVAVAGIHVIGYVYAAVEPLSWKELRDRAGFIHDIFVDETARGRSAGPRLLDAAVAWLRAQGVPRVLLWTAAPNGSARRFFEARGFRPTMVEMTKELD